MANNFESFHPCVIIDAHFDALINRIDVKTEEILEKKIQNRNKKIKLTDDDSPSGDALNQLREKQLKQIEEIKEINLKNFEKFNLEEYETEWSHIIDNASLVYREKIDRIKEEIIAIDCILLERSTVSNGLNLWITSWFHNQKNLEILE